MATDSFGGTLIEDSKLDQFGGTIINDKPEKPASSWRRVADVGISAVKGAIGVPESIVGLADIVTGGRAGKLAEEAGFRPKEAKAILDEYLSPQQQAANKALADTKGFFPTVGTALQNPSTILHSAIESLPLMGAGGVAARGLVKAAGTSPWVAGAVGEGLASAGQNAEQVRQETPGGLLSPGQAATQVASGFGTGALALAGAGLARKLKIRDIDTWIAEGKLAAPVGASGKGFARRLAEGAVSEGVFEELPQSLQEQMWQNYALDKPIMEGVPEAGAMGMLTGAVMGGPAAALGGNAQPVNTPPELNPRDKLLNDTAEAVIRKSRAEQAMEADAKRAQQETKNDRQKPDTAAGQKTAKAAEEADAAGQAVLTGGIDEAALSSQPPVIDKPEPPIVNQPDKIKVVDAVPRYVDKWTSAHLVNSDTFEYDSRPFATEAEARADGGDVYPPLNSAQAISGETVGEKQAISGENATVLSEKQARIPDETPVQSAESFTEREQPANVNAQPAPGEALPAPATTIPAQPVAPQEAPKAQPPAIRQQLFAEWGGQKHPVESLEDASRKWEAFRDKTGAGVSEVGNGVRVVDQAGKEVARVSYNGRVWPAGEWKKGDKPIYVPESENPALETKTPHDLPQKAGAIQDTAQKSGPDSSAATITPAKQNLGTSQQVSANLPESGTSIPISGPIAPKVGQPVAESATGAENAPVERPAGKILGADVRKIADANLARFAKSKTARIADLAKAELEWRKNSVHSATALNTAPAKPEQSASQPTEGVAQAGGAKAVAPWKRTSADFPDWIRHKAYARVSREEFLEGMKLQEATYAAEHETTWQGKKAAYEKAERRFNPAAYVDLYDRVVKPAKPAESKPAAPVMEPWQMTKDEYVKEALTEAGFPALAKLSSNPDAADHLATKDAAAIETWKVRHRQVVQSAIAQGKPVPANVLAGYHDLAKPAAPVAEAAHVEDGKIEEVTGEVIRESVAEGAANTKLTLAQQREFMLAELDKAIAKAKTIIELGIVEDKKTGRLVPGFGKEKTIPVVGFGHSKTVDFAKVKGIGYVTIDVPGDGVFRVVNIKERLQALRRQASAAFKRGPKPPTAEGPAEYTKTPKGNPAELAKLQAENAKEFPAAEPTPESPVSAPAEKPMTPADHLEAAAKLMREAEKAAQPNPEARLAVPVAESQGGPGPERFEIGRKLTKEQKKEVMESLGDVYPENALQKEVYTDSRGEEVWRYPYTPELFRKSDITGAMVRHYVTLPDGKIAHPSELFPEFTQSRIDQEMRKREDETREKTRQAGYEADAAEKHQHDSLRESYDYWARTSEESRKRSAGGWATILPPTARTPFAKDGKFITSPTRNPDALAELERRGWVKTNWAEVTKARSAGVAPRQDSGGADSSAIARTANVAPDLAASVESVLTDADKAEAARELGEKEWSPVASKKFLQGYAEWLQQGARDLGTKLSALYAKVAAAVKNGLLSVAVAFNFNVAQPIMPVMVKPTQQTLTITKERPRADFKGVAASADAKITADWFVRNNNAGGNPFLLADKSHGLMYAFDGNGALIAKSPALFGASRGDTLTAEQAAKTLEQTRPEDKITPAGVFPSRIESTKEYGDVLNVADYEKTSIVVHRVYLGTPSEKRMQRLQSETADDNRVSYGCINALPEFIDDVIIPNFTGKSHVVILPDSTSAKSFFGINDSEFETTTQNIVGDTSTAESVSWGGDKYAIRPERQANPRSGTRRRKDGPDVESYSRGEPNIPQTQTEAFKRWSNNAPLITSVQADTHQFKTGEKIVVEAYHGTKRPDRVGTVFKRSRATSGPMAFHTSSPLLASNYSTSKQDTSLNKEDVWNYDSWFRIKLPVSRNPVNLDRAWYFLPADEKARIAERAPRVTTTDDGSEIVASSEDRQNGLGGYDQHLKESRGNHLKALIEEWLSSGTLYNDEESFLKVLKFAGVDTTKVEMHDPGAEFPAVYKNYIAMQNPLVTSDIPQSVRDALAAAAKYDRTRAKQGGYTWDKVNRTLRDWVKEFQSPENTYVWTSIPDKVTEVFESLGYDGIVDWSGKGAGEHHPVYIPFHDTQIKSAIGNKGGFSLDKKNILLSQTDEPGPGLPAADIRAHIAGITEHLSVPVTIYDDVAAARADGAAVPDDTRGFAARGRLSLVAENIKTLLDAEFTLFHELFHVGIRAVSRQAKDANAAFANYTAALNRVAMANPEVRRRAKVWRDKYGAEKAEQFKAAGIEDNLEARVRLTSFDEAIADMAGDRRGKPITRLNELIAALQRLVRALGFDELASWMESRTDAEVLSLIRSATQAVSKGTVSFGGVMAGEPSYARRIYRDFKTVRDFIVPETPEYEGDMTGDLATFPAGIPGVEPLPIRLPVGIARGAHHGFGIEHLDDNAKRDAARRPPQATQDQGENFARQVATLATTANELYRDGGRLAFRSPSLREALILEKAVDLDDEPYYSVVTVVPSVRVVWGNTVWRGRADLPTVEIQQPGASDRQPVNTAAETGPSTAEVQTEKYDINRKRPAPQVEYKRRREIDPESFSRLDQGIMSELQTNEDNREITDRLQAALQAEGQSFTITPVSLPVAGDGTLSARGEREGRQDRLQLGEGASGVFGKQVTGADPDIMHARAADEPFNAIQQSRGVANAVAGLFKSPSALGPVNFFNTPFHKAEMLERKGIPGYKRVFQRLQLYLNDISGFAVQAEQLMPSIMRELKGIMPKDFRAYFKGAASEADIAAIGPWLNHGTLYGGGSPMEGVVWTDDELRGNATRERPIPRGLKPLTAAQIPLYRQARAGIGQSLETSGKAVIHRHVTKFGITFDRDMSLADVAEIVRDQVIEKIETLQMRIDRAKDEAGTTFTDSRRLEAEIKNYQGARAGLHDLRAAWEKAKAADDKASKYVEKLQAEQATLEALRGDTTEEADRKRLDREKANPGTIRGIAQHAKALIDHGYMPLKRFGNKTVTAYDEDGNTKFFGAYDGTPLTPGSANREMLRVAAEVKALHPEWRVVTGTRSEKAWKMYQGLSMDALENFLDFLDPETKAELERDKTIQEYLKNAVNDHSVLKQLIHRKGTPGFSTDVPRILASFVTSHARNASGLYHLSEAKRLVGEIPDQYGTVKDEAAELVDYVTKPGEEAAVLRSFLFFNFLGGSVAAAAINLTQTVMTTAPYLSQYTGVGKLTAAIGRAGKLAVGDPAVMTGELGKDLQRAELEGITAPQQIYHLAAMASNNPFSSDRRFRTAMAVWNGMFGAAEVFNRRIAFIAAHDIATERGMNVINEQLRKFAESRGEAAKHFDNAYDFAADAVDQTQFVYNKANRMNAARGPIGATVMTFKTFSVSWLELLRRLPPKQQLVMLGVLVLLAGAEGLPFEEDLADAVDTLGQWLGFTTNTGKWTGKAIRETLGSEFERPILKGLGGMLPIDLHSRLGLPNLIPGTAFAKPSEIDKTRDVAEAFGPVGGIMRNLMDGLQLMARGKWDRAALQAAPKAARDFYNGAYMMATGESQDTKGRLAMTDMTAAEGLGKLIGFNPQRAAREGEARREEMLDKNLRTVRMDEIASDWADGVIRKDQDKQKAARERLREWNRDNPELRIDGQQILRSVRERVKSARMTSQQRFLKSLPKTMRPEAREAFR